MVKIKATAIILIGGVLVSFLFYGVAVFAGTLSCSVATTCPSGTVIWRMSGTSNAHAELPSQSLYTQLVCCSGVTGLGTSCTGTFATALKLSGTTNAHSEQNSQANYANNACISVPSGGSVSVGYQATNCTGFDTTLGSMTGTTNAHVGNSAAYPSIQICATAAAAAATVSCSVDNSSTAFGVLTTSAVATSSPNVTASSTCTYSAGCAITVLDAGSGSNPGLWNSTSSVLIESPNAAYNATATLAAGTEGFGVRAATTSAGAGGTLGIVTRYNTGLANGLAGSVNDIGGLATSSLTLASSTSAITTAREIVITHKSAISNTTPAGTYNDTITYGCTAN